MENQQENGTDSSSLGAVSAQTQRRPNAHLAFWEWFGKFITDSSAAIGVSSLPTYVVSASNNILVIARANEAVFTTTSYDSREIAKAKLKRLKAIHFSPEGREARVARALEILSLPGPSFHADKETWVWAAEDPDIEDI